MRYCLVNIIILTNQCPRSGSSLPPSIAIVEQSFRVSNLMSIAILFLFSGHSINMIFIGKVIPGQLKSDPCRLRIGHQTFPSKNWS